MVKRIIALGLLFTLVLCGCGTVGEIIPDTKQQTGDDTPEKVWKELYRKKIGEYYSENKEYESEYSKVSFNLIYFDDDDIPELVADLTGYRVSLYTYRNGQVVPILEDWPYGAMGNTGYDYFPRKGIVHNLDNDYAGAIVYEYFGRWDPETCEIISVNDEELSSWAFNDLNEDGMLNDSEINAQKPLEERIYYYGNNQITKEEYDACCIKGDTEELAGSLTYDEIIENLAEAEAKPVIIRPVSCS